MGRQDSAPDPQKPALLPFDLLQRPQTPAELLRHAPHILQTRIQETIRNPEEANRKNAQHAAKMGIDPEAVMKKWGLKKSNTILITPSPTLHFMRRQDTVVPVGQARVISPEANVQVGGATIPPEQGNIPSPEDDVQMDDLDTSIEHHVSAPGSVPGTNHSMSPTKLDHPDMQHEYVEQRQVPQQDNSTQRHRVRTHQSTQRGHNIRGLKERKLKTEMVRENSTKISKKLVEASRIWSAADSVAESSKTTAAPEAVKGSTEPLDYTPSLFVSHVDKYPVLDLPKWYKDITNSSIRMKEIAKKRPQSLTALESLKNCIGRCESKMQLVKPADRRMLMVYFEELREHVHKAEFLPNITMFLVKAARILTAENGLPRVFGEDAGFPPDLKADAYQLYARWMRGEFQQDVLRGIVTVKGLNRGSDRLDPAYRTKHPTTAKYYGDKGLVMGQCWPSQLCTVRDGAHGSSQGGIFGEKEKGTYSIVLSGGGGYQDQDNGDTIIYSGTEGKNFTPTEATQQMITSCGLDNEIRVIRSHQLSAKNKYRPEVGLRYDGLYEIKSYELVDEEKQIYLFKLERCPDQETIRYGRDAASRPTKFEIAEYKKLKGKI